MPEGQEIQHVAQIADYILSLIRDDSGNRWLIFSKGLETQVTIGLNGDITGSVTTDFSQGTAGHSGNNQITTTIGNKKVTHSKLDDSAVENNNIADQTIELGKIALSAFGNSDPASDNDGHITTHAQLVSYVASILRGYGQNYGVLSVADINAMTLDNLNNGDLCIVGGIDEQHPANVITLGNLTVRNGENLIFHKTGTGASTTGVWQSVDGEFKLIQTAVSDPASSGSGIDFIATISQNTNGEITVTKKSVRIANGSQSGAVTLSDSHTSTSGVNDGVAATPQAVKDAYDLASGKAGKVANATENNLAALDANGDLKDSGKKASDFATSAQGSKADSAIQGVKVNNTELTKDSANKVNIPLAVAPNQSQSVTGNDGAMSKEDKALVDTISDKANKVANATENNFAALDANGDLKDSGKKASDFSDVHHSHGNINEQGQILSTGAAAISNGCAIVYTDQTNLIKKSTETFDGSSDYIALTKKGTFVEVVKDVKLGSAQATPLVKTNGAVVIPMAAPTGTGETSGLMSAADKAKLDGIETDSITATDVADMWAALTA